MTTSTPPNTTPMPSEPNVEPLFATHLTVEALRKEAIDIAVQLTKDFPNDADVFFLLGIVYRILGNSAEAAKCWERCLEINPDHDRAYYNMGQISFQKGKYEKAVQLWQKVLENNPKLPGIYNCFASALMCLGRAREAVEAFQKDIELSKWSFDSHFMLGQQYLLLKEYDKAAAEQIEYVNGRPDTPMGRLRAQNGHPKPFGVKWWAVLAQRWNGQPRRLPCL